MNIIKGIDRIAFAVAIIAAVLAFIVFSGGYYEFKKVTLVKDRKTGEYVREKPQDRSSGLGYRHNAIPTIPRDYSIRKYITPPLWQTLLAGAAGAGCTFLVVLFGIRLTTRGIKRFSLWIIDGFKDENKPKE